MILKQQQQKSAIRQEKGLQETTGAPTPGTPLHWSQEHSIQPSNVFLGRPPPPYPGIVRASPMHGGQRFPAPFPGDQQVTFPDETHCPQPQFSRDMSSNVMRPQGSR